MIKHIAMIAFATLSMSSYGLKEDPAYLDARRNGAETKIVLKVVDDMGVVVSNVTVDIFFGMNFRPKGHAISGETDETGIFTAVGKTCGDEIEIASTNPDIIRQGGDFAMQQWGRSVWQKVEGGCHMAICNR